MLVSVDLARLRAHTTIIEDELRQIRYAQELLQKLLSETQDVDGVQFISCHLKSARQIEEMILERKKILELVFDEMSDLRVETESVLKEALQRINAVAAQEIKGGL